MGKYFGTDGIRGKVGDANMSPDFIVRLGRAAGKVLAADGNGKVLIGKDTRISGYMFESALEAGLIAAGVDTRLLGPIPTPAIAYLTHALRADAGIVVSASHNPYHDNGIKFLGADGGKLPDALEAAIEAELEQDFNTVACEKLGNAKRINDASGRYIEFCKSTFPNHLDLRGLTVVVDSANGAGYVTAPRVFRELGARVISIHDAPDGFNINHNCGATAPQALQRAVLAYNADVGIALDGDGDRLMMVDANGNLLDGDEIIYLIARAQQQNGTLQGGVVGTVMSNLGLEQALGKLGIEFIRAQVGDRHILKALKQNHWHLGAEPSGHILCLHLSPSGDAIIAALQVLAQMRSCQQPLAQLRGAISKLPQIMINVPKNRAIDAGLQQQIDALAQNTQASLQNRGRVLLRPSGTEPLIRVMLEGDNAELIERLCRELATQVSALIS